MLISSTQNNHIKELRLLYKDKKARRSEGVFICEGYNICKDIPDQIKVKSCFIKQSEMDMLDYFTEKFTGRTEVFAVADAIFDGIADTKSPSGVILVAERPYMNKDINKSNAVLLCEISDPGNLGTIIRTAAAFGTDDIICVNCTDAYAPKSVRATMGGIFYTNVIETTDYDEAFSILKDYHLIGLDMQGISIYSYKKTKRTAIAVGSEAHGLPKVVRDNCKNIISLPMKENRVESLNAAVSVGIAMFLI